MNLATSYCSLTTFLSTKYETSNSSRTAKYILNPPIKTLFALGVVPPGYVLLETIGRQTGKARRTAVGNARVGDRLWIVAEHGMKADTSAISKLNAADALPAAYRAVESRDQITRSERKRRAAFPSDDAPLL
jgi:hypothetical protein